MTTTVPPTTSTATRAVQNYVGGRWTPSRSPQLLDVTNPATGAVLARAPLSTRDDVDAAVRAARRAFAEWRERPVIARAQWLFSLRQALVTRADDLARSVTREMGKTLPDAHAEVQRAIEMVECASAVPTSMQGRILEGVATNVDCQTIRQPVGVCAAIVPFNFPMMVPFWFMPFAIACGNTFILKPSEQVPLTQELVFGIIDGLGLPAGVVNLVNGGAAVVDAILEHPVIDAVSFVGSARVARHVYETAAAHGKRVQALGGAKNHMVVMPDAVLDKTVTNIVSSAFGAAGQRCMAGSVVVTVGAAHAPLLEGLRAATEGLRVGDGMDDGVAVGPLVSPGARDRVRASVDRALAEGAHLLVDGRGVEGHPGGAFLGPTILVDVTPEMEAARDEIFGPVLSVIHTESLDDA
ncbi:MAG TPA: CoA-acylating methylmalonate-semialdehyde dehydrogenase, partial [Solirubrobacteraceae bacterium]